MSLRARIAAFAVMLVAAAAGWALLRSTPSPIAPAGGAGATPAASATVRAAAESVEPSAMRVAAAPASDERPIPPDATWIEVHVADGDTGEPASGAEVAWCTGTSPEHAAMSPNEGAAYDADPELAAFMFGWRTTADAAGIARIAVVRSANVYARRAGRSGHVFVVQATEPAGGWRLPLHDDRNVTVFVRDASDQPAFGVPVQVSMHDADGVLLRDYEWGAKLFSAAPDGSVKLAHLQRWVVPGGLGATVAQWRVRIAIPGIEGSAVLFDPLPAAAEPIVLRLPPTGRVVARFFAGGRALDPWGGARLALAPGAQPRSRLALDAAADEAGLVTFPRVPLGQRLAVSAMFGAERMEQTFDGPVVAGQEVRVDVAPDAADLVLTGRFTDADHAPITSTFVAAVRTKAGDWQQGTSLRADRDGRFVWLLGKVDGDHTDLGDCTLTVRRAGHPPSVATIASRKFPPGVHDLGDVVLAPPPLVVRGRIVCPGVDDLAVALKVTAATSESGFERWESVPGISRQVSQRDGTFELRGVVGAGRFRLELVSRELLPIAPVPFVLGQDDLEIRAARAVTLAVAVLLPEAASHGFHARLRPREEVAVDSDRLVGRVENVQGARHDLQWRGLSSGRYDLDLHLFACDAPVATVDDVRLPLPVGGDPRLVDIDLRQVVRVVTLRAPQLEEAIAFPMPQDPALPLRGYEFLDGEANVPTGNATLDVLVCAKGRRPTQFTSVAGERSIELEPWISVPIDLPALRVLPQGVFARVALEPVPPRERRIYRGRSRSGWLDELYLAPGIMIDVDEGRALVPVGDGPHTLAVFLAADDQRSCRVAHGLVEHVHAGPGTITVPIDARALQAALEVVLGK